jgi:DNA invertase Pin-like site-specific DNA recombinase
VDPNAPKALGYIRVSTELQAADGVSLDAQRESIEDYCRIQGLNLIAVYQDDHTGKTLKRKGFQAALDHMKQSGATLVALKLDRITRNVGDLDYLLKTYFGDGKQFALKLVQFPVDTGSSIGRLILNIICSVAQWEREEICARTQMGLAYLKKQGVRLGGAPYGMRRSDEEDEFGRRILVNDLREQQTIARICELFDGNTSLHKIVKILTDEGHQPKEKGAWSRLTVARILERTGRQAMRPWNRTNAIRDKTTVINRIFELKADGLNLSEIGRQLTRENMMPVRGSKWYPATVSAYMSERASYNQDAIVKTVLALREQKRTLSQICADLTLRGFTPQRGGRWFPAQIKTILDANQASPLPPRAA